MINYEFDEENGIIRDKSTKERCVVIYESGIESVFKGLSRIFKSGIEVLLEEASHEAGKNLVNLTVKESNAGIKDWLDVYTKRLARLGWGRAELSELTLDESRMVIRVWNNVFAEIRNGNSTYCAYVGGLLSGVYEGLLHVVPRVKEVKCIGRGDPYCEFLLDLKATSEL